MELNIFGHVVGREKNVAPTKVASTLTVKEEQRLPPIGSFSQVNGTIMRSAKLFPDRYGDAIWSSSNGNAAVVIDTSSPRGQYTHLDEAGMVKDMQDRLAAVFNSTSVTPQILLKAINDVLTTPGRIVWRGQDIEFGLSLGGVCSMADKLFVFNIGTGAVFVGDKMVIVPTKEFHNPYFKSGSKVVKALVPTVLELDPTVVDLVVACTDGINLKSYLPTSNRRITEFIAPGAKEATILRLEK